MKVLVTFLTIIAITFSAGIAFKSSQDSKQAKNELSTERYQRMVAEEGLSKTQTELTSAKLKIEKSDSKIKSVEARLNLAESKSTDLQAKVDQYTALKTEMEGQIKILQDKFDVYGNLASKPPSIPGLE
ncbi:MAG: peptidoglycan hydrolase CwlO-like protein [Lysobacterales bacterium]|jgi:peptidoglycan hydrolase CwlO-like protein